MAERVLAMREKALGPAHPDVAISLARLGNLYREKGQYGRAEPLLTRALAIEEKARGPEDAYVGRALNDLGLLYKDRGDYARAAPLYERALALKPDSADVRTDYGNTFFQRQDFARALAEYRKSVALDPAHVNSWRNIVVASLNLNELPSPRKRVGRLAANLAQPAHEL